MRHLGYSALQPVHVPRQITLGQESSDTSGRFIFSAMLLGFGVALGFALGVNQGVRVSRGG